MMSMMARKSGHYSIRWRVRSFAGDAPHDRDDVYGAVNARHPGAAIIVPPRAQCRAKRLRPHKRDGTCICSSSPGVVGWFAEGIRLQLAALVKGGHQPHRAGDRRRTTIAHGQPAATEVAIAVAS
jgi:hypothetical protein